MSLRLKVPKCKLPLFFMCVITKFGLAMQTFVQNAFSTAEKGCDFTFFRFHTILDKNVYGDGMGKSNLLRNLRMYKGTVLNFDTINSPSTQSPLF